MKQIDIAYIAGLIDGEGYIGIKRQINRANGSVNHAYTERIQIRMVDEQAIAFIASLLGGNYYKEKQPHKNRRPLYCYQASDRIANTLIKTILPFLKVKREVANTVIQLRPIKENPSFVLMRRTVKNRWGGTMVVGRRQHHPNYIAKMHILWERCRELNRVGT